MQQPLAIAIFTRTPDCDPQVPAIIHYTAVHGHRNEKYAALQTLSLDGPHWQPTRAAWQAPFTPAAQSQWDDYPALNDLLPWSSTGVTANRNWPSAPAAGVLKERLKALVAEPDLARKAELFKETDASTLAMTKDPFGAADTEPNTTRPFASETATYLKSPAIVRYGCRSFDRQWIVADRRLLDRSRPELWAARRPGQVFVVEQHSQPIADGPAAVFSALIPDAHHFNGRGGRVLPMLHPGGRVNMAKGLLGALSTISGRALSADDLVAYIAGVAAHPGFTQRFAEELDTPGVRIPITGDAELFERAIHLGREVVWLHTYGQAFTEGHDGGIRYPTDDPRRITNLTTVSSLPLDASYDPETAVLSIGSGSFGPVPAAVWDYTVGGRAVIKSWFNYRKANPTGRRTSALDDINASAWPAEWNGELIDLLSVLNRLVELEPAQAELLGRILDRPVASYSDLASAGVEWPGAANDPRRRANQAPVAKETQADDDVDGQLGFTFH